MNCRRPDGVYPPYIVLWLIFLLLWDCLSGVPVQAQGQRLVLAFYYAWYDEKTWSYDKVPDMPVSPYRSADRATIERHVQEARRAGIDAFVQSWYGPGTNPTEGNLRTLLDVAQAHGMQATVDFETTSPFMPNLESAINGLSHLVNVHSRHAAFLRYDGRPVIFFWRQQHYSLDTWAAIRAQIDPGHSTIWIADGDNTAWLGVFDGLHMYNITWRVNTNPLYTATKMRKRVDQYKTDHGVHRFWVATAMPGYDDTHIQGRAHPYVYPRSPNYYRSTWQAAMASNPEMVIITSYNEWREGTMIEPSVTYGDTYLNITHEMAALFKSGTPGQGGGEPASANISASTPKTPTATPTVVPTATSTPTPTATSTTTPTATWTSTPTATETPTATPSPQPTATPTPSRTATATLTHTSVPTASPTYTSTALPDASGLPGAPNLPDAPGLPDATQTLTITYISIGMATSMATATPGASSTPVTSLGPSCLGAGALLACVIGFVWSRRAGRSQNTQKE